MDLITLLNDHQMYHSELQQDYFITTKTGGTLYGQYKQALRELYKRFRGLKELYYNLEILEIDIEELNSNETVDKWQKRRNKIEEKKKIMDKVELEKNIADTEREFKRFYQQAYSLKKVIGELTEEKRNKLDKEMWIYKLKEMCSVDYISTGRLRQSTIELMHCLPIDDRKDLLSSVRNHEELLKWFESKEEKYNLLEIECDLQKLLE